MTHSSKNISISAASTEQIIAALVKRGRQRVEGWGWSGGELQLLVDGLESDSFSLPEPDWALGDLRKRQLAAGVWPWYEARFVVDCDEGVVLLELDDWQTKPAWVDFSNPHEDAAIPASYAHELHGYPRAMDRVPVWIKELMASVGRWDLVTDTIAIDTDSIGLVAPNFPSDSAVVEARAARVVERARVEATGGVWRDKRLTVPVVPVWEWPETDQSQVLDVKVWRAVKKRWQELARQFPLVKTLRKAPPLERVAPGVRPVVKVFPGVTIAGSHFGFLDAEVLGSGFGVRGSHQPLWLSGRDGLTCPTGVNGSLGPVMRVDGSELKPTSVSGVMGLFDRLADWVEEFLPKIRETAEEEAEGVSARDRRFDQALMEKDLVDQLLQDFIDSLGKRA